MESTEPPHLFFLIASLLVLFLLSMFFSSAETAFLSMNKLKLRFLREQKNKAAIRAEKILQNKQTFFSAILIGNSIVNIAISVVLTSAALQLFGQAGLSIAVGVATVLLLIFGEILPKSIALVYAHPMGLAFARILLLFMTVLSPVVWLFSTFTGVLLGFCGIHKKADTGAVTESDLQDFFETSEENGLMGSDERLLLNKILHYGDVSARTIMTPRTDIEAIHIDTSAEVIIELAQESHFSRFPVYDTDIDSIIGFFYLKDFLFSSEYLCEMCEFDIKTYLRTPVFVFETTKLAQLEQKFHTEQQNMAIVLDEYGGTAGLVTVEDLNEEVFGTIIDEYDEAGEYTPETAESAADTAVEEQCFSVAGTTRLSELEERLHIQLESEYHETIAGYLMEAAGDIPQCGFTAFIESYRFTVLEMSTNRIETVEVCFEDTDS